VLIWNEFINNGFLNWLHKFKMLINLYVNNEQLVQLEVVVAMPRAIKSSN